MRLASAAEARRIDAEASASWGLPRAALVEAAGRACARILALDPVFAGLFMPGARRRPEELAVLAGRGNNGADALVLARALVLEGVLPAASVLAVLADGSPSTQEGRDAAAAARALGIRVSVWDGPSGEAARGLSASAAVVDGLCGTGASGPLRGAVLEMARAAAAAAASPGGPRVFAVDVPSGLSDGFPVDGWALRADATLAVEPRKACLYHPSARPFAGRILGVGGVFPPALLASVRGPDLLDFAEAAAAVPPVPVDAYKHRRGVVEIRAGARGSSGAAVLSARGAQAAGAGLVRLVVDACIRAELASAAPSVMVAEEADADGSRFRPDAVLAGPGWGSAPSRAAAFEAVLEAEEGGAALVLDADALDLARGRAFRGRTVLTPHPAEFARWLGSLSASGSAPTTDDVLQAAAAARAVVVLKGHVVRIASFDGRLAYVDGMAPALASGGTGDVLAGLAAGIAARTIRAEREGGPTFDPFSAAAAAAALLMEAGRRAGAALGFCSAEDVAREAAAAAGSRWLPGGPRADR